MNEIIYLIENKNQEWYSYGDNWVIDANEAMQFDDKLAAQVTMEDIGKKHGSLKVTEHEFINPLNK